MPDLAPLSQVARDAIPNRDAFRDIPKPPAALSAVTLKVIATNRLLIDTSYQRRLSERGRSEIRKIVIDFSWARFGALSLARVGENYAITDGQHRAIAAHILGLEDVPAIVSTATAPDQATDFLGINTVRSSITSVDKFRARVAAGDGSAVEVAAMLDAIGIDFDVTPGCNLKQGQTRSATKIEKLSRKLGIGTVQTALETLLQAQPTVDDLLSAFAIEVTTHLTHLALEANADITRLDRVLAETDFTALKDSASLMQKNLGEQAYTHGLRILRKEINKGLRTASAV